MNIVYYKAQFWATKWSCLIILIFDNFTSQILTKVALSWSISLLKSETNDHNKKNEWIDGLMNGGIKRNMNELTNKWISLRGKKIKQKAKKTCQRMTQKRMDKRIPYLNINISVFTGISFNNLWHQIAIYSIKK